MTRIASSFAASLLAISAALTLGPAAAEDRSSTDMLAAFLADFGAGNIEALVEAHAEDAVFLTPQGALKGRDQIRGAIAGFLEEFGAPGATFEVVQTYGGGPVAQLIWKGETARAKYNFAAETYVFVDGKIAWHTFAADVTPKGN